MIYVLCAEPIQDRITFEDQNEVKGILYIGRVFLSFWFLGVGLIYLYASFSDMMRCDLLGFRMRDYLLAEGVEFPRPFIMKHLSRIALSCRNPLMTGPSENLLLSFL